MDEISISKFKATCLAVLERVRRTGQPIRVTRFGKAVADIVPPAESQRPKRRLGTLGGGRIIGDIVGPIGDESDWEAAQEAPPWDPFPKDSEEKE
jgi:prevent-host-death family protein